MKRNYVLLASICLISVSTFAQKDQIKAAEKALKNGNAVEAKEILLQAESVISSASDAEKASYFMAKGKSCLDIAASGKDVLQNQLEAVAAFKEVISVEKSAGKSKYSAQAQSSLDKLKSDFVNKAIEEGTAKNYSSATKYLRMAYDTDTTDVEKLYYAANYAVNAKEYDLALAYYLELKKLNYTGEGVLLYATNKESKTEEAFSSKQERDIYVKGGSHENPRDEKIPSKRGEIYKNISLLLIEQGKVDEAKAAIADARKVLPDDVSLMISEAELYLKLNDLVTYKKIVADVLEKNPNSVDLIFNLGVISYNNKEYDVAEKHYLRVIELDPNYGNAYLNLAILKLDAEKILIDKMNSLGTSAADNKKYDILKKQRNDVFKSAIPYLEKVVELDAKNTEAIKTLMNVYKALEMFDKAKVLKEKLN